MLVQIVHPDTSKPFPSVVANGRRCYAVPAGARFAVLCTRAEVGATLREAADEIDPPADTDVQPQQAAEPTA